jgi:hypothetical protein
VNFPVVQLIEDGFDSSNGGSQAPAALTNDHNRRNDCLSVAIATALQHSTAPLSVSGSEKIYVVDRELATRGVGVNLHSQLGLFTEIQRVHD